MKLRQVGLIALPFVLTATGVLADDGVWKAEPPPFERFEHTAVYDPVRDRMVVFGGHDFNITFNDTWALPLAGSPAWSPLDPVGSRPSPRHGHTAIYDPLRDRIVVFGGHNRSGNQFYNDVWALSLAGIPAWTILVTAGSPPSARFGHTAFYDPVRDRMVVFGGSDGISTRNDTWALSLGGTPTWSALAPAGSPPAARRHHTAIYDPVRDRMLVYGGSVGSDNHVWELKLAGSPAWSMIAPAGSPPYSRWRHTAFYDPARDRMVIFGGLSAGFRNDVWVLSLAGSPVWNQLAPAGSPPLPRLGHTTIYDPVRDRMVVFGGENGDYYHGSNDVWALSLEGSPAWGALSSAGPSPRGAHTAIYDPLRHSLVVFGGHGTPPPHYCGCGLQSFYNNDVWSLSLAGSPAVWSAPSIAGLPPAARSGHTAIYDPMRDRMVVFGGYDDGYVNDVWALSLAGTPAWIALDPVGSPPAARYCHTAIYDPVRDRMVVFGGSSDGHLNNDVWALSLAGSPAWSAITPAGSQPLARFGHAAFHDPPRDPVDPPPAARGGHTAFYDPVRDRMVVFGGYGVDGLRNDVWALSLAGTPAWTALAPAGDTPSARDFHTAIYDPVRDRMVVFGGSNSGGDPTNDAWALSLAGTPAWSALAPAGSQHLELEGHVAIYDPVRDRIVVFGGLNGGGMYSNDVWALEWEAQAVSVPGATDAHRRRYELAAPRPNPSRGVTSVDFEIAEPSRVVLDVLDIHGRRVRRIADEWFTAGHHASMWRGDDDRGHALASGVYFVRMQGTGFQAMRRIARIR